MTEKQKLTNKRKLTKNRKLGLKLLVQNLLEHPVYHA